MIRVPVPLCSLYSLLHGIRGEMGSSRFITFAGDDHTSFVKEGSIDMLGKSMYFKKCVAITPHFFVHHYRPCKRLYACVELWEHTLKSPRMVREVMQIEEILPNDYNILIHVEKNRPKKTLFHHKWYQLTDMQIHNLTFTR